MSRNLTLLLSILCLTTIANGQCTSGNCQDGKGRYDFGWCVYEGDFKNAKPDGTGRMQYDDYRYEGNFRNGVEDGEGIIIYKDGHEESVRYKAGQKVETLKKLAASDYKPVYGTDPGCLEGDCVNGYGTYQFPSGNKYTGNFVNFKREGEGTFYFATGDMFSGTWHNNEKENGVYTYASGARYTGTYDSTGNALNGVVTAGTRRVQILNGKAIIVKEELYGYKTAKEIEQDNQRAEIAKKRKTTTTAWGNTGPSAAERDKNIFDKIMRDADRGLKRMDEAWRRY